MKGCLFIEYGNSFHLTIFASYNHHKNWYTNMSCSFLSEVRQVRESYMLNKSSNDPVFNIDTIPRSDNYLDDTATMIISAEQKYLYTRELNSARTISLISSGEHAWVTKLLNKNLVVSGGFVQQYATHSMKSSTSTSNTMPSIDDIDLFHVHENASLDTLLEQLEMVGRVLAEEWKGTKIEVFRSNHAFTFVSSNTSMPKCQVMISKYRNIAEILSYFDLGSSMLVWDGSNQLMTNNMGYFSYKYMANIIDRDSIHTGYMRIYKYSKRGFSLIVPSQFIMLEVPEQLNGILHHEINNKEYLISSQEREEVCRGIILDQVEMITSNIYEAETRAYPDPSERFKCDAIESLTATTYASEYNYRDWNTILMRNLIIIENFHKSLNNNIEIDIIKSRLHHLVSRADFAVGMNYLDMNDFTYGIKSLMQEVYIEKSRARREEFLFGDFVEISQEDEPLYLLQAQSRIITSTSNIVNDPKLAKHLLPMQFAMRPSDSNGQ
jgi:hypothetical protein